MLHLVIVLVKIDNQKLLANEYINLGQYTNDKIFNSTSIININYYSENLHNNGSIQFSLKMAGNQIKLTLTI